MNYPKITFSIPTYNAEKHLVACLNSIKRQKYPKEKLEILVADGGSEDRTVEIAKEFGARVLNNPKRLADYGAKINAKNATGDLFVIFAADN
jgi:glycosyltransferase involved in cell wall biosynthesis